MQVGDVVRQVERAGGVARRAGLACTDAELKRTLEQGFLIRLRRGLYALPSIAAAPRLAYECGGVLSHTSAALAWGWPVAAAPRKPHVMVPRGRTVSGRRGEATLHWGVLTRDERLLGRTSPLATVANCARTLPLLDALCVADGALASGAVGVAELERCAEQARGHGSRALRRVAGLADPASASALETAARLLLSDVPGLHLRSQVRIAGLGVTARVDFADVDLGLVVECDGYSFHGGRTEFVKDRRRYSGLALLDWVVVLLTWEDVFLDGAATRARVETWVRRELVRRRTGLWRDTVGADRGL